MNNIASDGSTTYADICLPSKLIGVQMPASQSLVQ